MANLAVPSISTELFTWVSATRTFAAEASSLGDFRPSRLYDDACDVGFELVSQWTNRKTRWCLAKELRDGENELQGWEFTPTPETLREIPSFGQNKVVIFND